MDIGGHGRLAWVGELDEHGDWRLSQWDGPGGRWLTSVVSSEDDREVMMACGPVPADVAATLRAAPRGWLDVFAASGYLLLDVPVVGEAVTVVSAVPPAAQLAA